MALLLSLNVGRAEPSEAKSVGITGIGKRPFAARMGEPQWVRRFTEVGRSGAYLAVVSGGTVRPGDPIEVVSRPAHDVRVPEVFRAFSGDLDAAERVLAANALPEVEAVALRV